MLPHLFWLAYKRKGRSIIKNNNRNANRKNKVNWLVSLIDLKVQIARGITFLTPVAMLNILSQTFVWQQNKANFSGNWKLI